MVLVRREGCWYEALNQSCLEPLSNMYAKFIIYVFIRAHLYGKLLVLLSLMYRGKRFQCC